jgi:hypothetical protein
LKDKLQFLAEVMRFSKPHSVLLQAHVDRGNDTEDARRLACTRFAALVNFFESFGVPRNIFYFRIIAVDADRWGDSWRYGRRLVDLVFGMGKEEGEQSCPLRG